MSDLPILKADVIFVLDNCEFSTLSLKNIRRLRQRLRLLLLRPHCCKKPTKKVLKHSIVYFEQKNGSGNLTFSFCHLTLHTNATREQHVILTS